MGGGTIRGWMFASVAGLAFCVAAGAIVGAAQVVGSGAFSMPTIGGTRDIWTGPANKPAGVKVKVTTGKVRVDHVAPSGTVALGPVQAGNSCVFEGGFNRLRVEALSNDTNGEWENRAPTQANATDVDRLIGDGAIEMQTGAESFNVYSTPAALARVIVVTAGVSDVGVGTVRNGPDLLKIDGRDTAFVSLGNVTEYYINGHGLGNARFRIFDPTAGGAPISCGLCGRDGETDRVSVDGTRALSIVLTNAGPGTVTVTKQMTGDTTPTVLPPLAPGDSSPPCAGLVSRFDWTYSYTSNTNAKTRVDVVLTGP